MTTQTIDQAYDEEILDVLEMIPGVNGQAVHPIDGDHRAVLSAHSAGRSSAATSSAGATSTISRSATMACALLAGIPTRSPSFMAAASAAEIQRFDPRRAITTSDLSASKASAFRTARRHAVLQSVAAEIGEQCEIGIVRNNVVAYVDSVRVTAPQGLQFEPGGTAPLHCTSTGKIYLSTLPAKAREKLVHTLPMVRHTERTITDPDDLLALLEQTRTAGWARTNEEFVKGSSGSPCRSWRPTAR